MIAGRALALAATLLALSGCTGPEPWLRTGEPAANGEIPRDSRGEPVLPGIAPPPAAVAQAPPTSLDGRKPAKPVSCQHYRRCL